MNLKLSALIFFTSTLISLSASFPQVTKDDEFEEIRATPHDFAQRPVPTLEVVPVDFFDLNPPEKRDQLELPPVKFYVCSEPLLKGRCEKLSSKRGFCYKLKNGWNDKISSFCPPPLTKCTVYDDDNCKDPFLKDVQWPGITDLTVPLPPNGLSYIDNSIGSYSCV